VGDVQDSLDLRVLRVIEELLRDRHPDQRPVDTSQGAAANAVNATDSCHEFAFGYSNKCSWRHSGFFAETLFASGKAADC
jgi:hypothetical protein